jgi:hypothetical protein
MDGSFLYTYPNQLWLVNIINLEGPFRGNKRSLRAKIRWLGRIGIIAQDIRMESYNIAGQVLGWLVGQHTVRILDLSYETLTSVYKGTGNEVNP